jgi:hypothetical protein
VIDRQVIVISDCKSIKQVEEEEIYSNGVMLCVVVVVVERRCDALLNDML